MALDLGTAVANIGGVWNNALQSQKQRETLEKQQFIENMLRQENLRLQQDAGARTADKQVFDQQMELAENYGGRQMPLAQAQNIFTHPKLQQLAVKPLEPRLASTSLAGVGQNGLTPQIAPSFEQSEGIAPGMAEIQTPIGPGMQIAKLNQEGATERAAANASLRLTIQEAAAKQKEELAGLHRDMTERIAQSRNDTAMLVAGMRQPTSEPLEEVQMADGTIKLVPRSQAAGMSPPRTQVRNNLTSTIADLEAANKLIDEIETLGNEIKWAGTGPVEARSDRFKSGLPLVGGYLTNPKEAELRTKIADLSSLVAHERYGAALTGGELGRAKKFLPEDTLNAIENVTRIRNMREFNKSKLAELKPSAGQRGVVNGANTDQAGAKPGAKPRWSNLQEVK